MNEAGKKSVELTDAQKGELEAQQHDEAVKQQQQMQMEYEIHFLRDAVGRLVNGRLLHVTMSAIRDILFLNGTNPGLEPHIKANIVKDLRELASAIEKHKQPTEPAPTALQ